MSKRALVLAKQGLDDGVTLCTATATGKAKDFGGASGDNTTVDCFNSTQTTANDIRQEDCKNITVTIKYKMVNAMNDTAPENEFLLPNIPDMELKTATFGQGNCGTDKGPLRNVGTGKFTDVTNSTVDPPRKRKRYGITTSSSHVYEATFNPCDTDGSNQFFMKMRFKPVKEAKDLFNTANCGTNDKVEFKIIAAEPSMAPSATPTTSAPTAAPIVEPIKDLVPSPMPSNDSTPAPQEPDKVTSAPSPAPSSAKGKGGKGPKSPGKSRVRKTLRGY
eukprot:scaffold797_cov408-Chaetoceros_neogracile.AAC.63